MAIDIASYKAKFPTRKVVTLEDGIDFEIKILTPLDLWGENPIDKNKPAEFIKDVVRKGVVSPKITEEGDENSLAITELTYAHQSKLAEEILAFSGYGSKKEESFLSEGNNQ